MSTLQEATDYAVLIYASVMLLCLLVGIIIVFVVKAKIKKAKLKVKQGYRVLTNLPYIGKEVLNAVKNAK